MKLKERVVILVSCSCFLLLFLKYRHGRTSGLEALVAVDILEEANTLKKLELDLHYHAKRESRQLDEINDKSQKASQRDTNIKNANVFEQGKAQEAELIFSSNSTIMHPWDIWFNMVTNRHITSPNDRKSVERILGALTLEPIKFATVGYKGTQLKALLVLNGPSEQMVAFKPLRYSRDHVIHGMPYDGYDRHNAEIAAFHLDRILGFYRAPPVAGRRVNLETEVKPIAERKLLKTFFKNDNGDTCFYGVCYYCSKSEPACASGNIMEGSITIWLPPGWELAKSRHPWQRTYTKRKARWEIDADYCNKVIKTKPYDSGPRLLDLMDTAIFDFLIGNADRHHYETFRKDGNKGMLIHLDNAKSFGNPEEDEISILTPIFQCCRLRKSTYDRLQQFSTDSSSAASISKQLQDSLKNDAVAPILTVSHLLALDRRLQKTFDTLNKCIESNGKENVIIDDGL